jgi:hypothetical protein
MERFLPRGILLGLFTLCCHPLVAELPEPPDIALDPLIEVPECWSLTPDELEEQFNEKENFGFVWLTEDRSRAKLSRYRYSNLTIDLSLYEGAVPVDEVTVDFEDGKLSVVSLSLYNRGDAPEPISADEFNDRFVTCGKKIGAALDARPQAREADSQQGLPIEGYFWDSRISLALLTHNEGAREGANREYLRLRFANPYSKSNLVQAMRNRRGGIAVRLSDLEGRVKNDEDGNTYIPNLPMVDQGNKGYCAVASTQRVFEYYGIGIDMHQIAEIADSDPGKGTNSYQMARELDEVDYRFKTRLEVFGMRAESGDLHEVKQESDGYLVEDAVEQDDFRKDVTSSIDEGIPLLWGLELGRFPEEPALSEQTEGFHMRTIIGYHADKDLLIFSDSWGAGHEFKTMAFGDAFQATTGLFRLKPIVH